MPKISVIVPVYRAEAFLRDCVDGILSQTFSDLEVYLVNDGSPDRCGEICDEYARQDSRVHVIHQKNQGQAAARNHAVLQATGEWVCFVDSDDQIHPQLLQRLYEASIAHGGISMCPMAEAPEIPEDFFAEPSDELEAIAMDERNLCALYDREEYPSWVACAKLIPREYVAKRPFCEGRVFEDNEAVCHWMYRTQTLIRLKAPMYYYRTNPGSTTQRGFTLKKLDYLWALESIIRFYDSVGYGEMKARFVSRYAQELVNCCNGLRYDLYQPDRIRAVEKNTRSFLKEQNIRFSKEQKEQILDAMHPAWMRIYWPVNGVVQTIRSSGISGLLRKVKKHLKRGEDQ